MEEVTKTDLDERKEVSNKMQYFKQTEYYALIHDKLWDDYRAALLKIKAKEDAEARAKINYIEELFGFIDSKANDYELVDLIIKQKKEDW